MLVQCFVFVCLILRIPARDLTEEERKGYREVTWDDKEVCGAYMVRFCPHDLFVNTRSDLGEFCGRILIHFVLCSTFYAVFQENQGKKNNPIIELPLMTRKFIIIHGE